MCIRDRDIDTLNPLAEHLDGTFHIPVIVDHQRIDMEQFINIELHFKPDILRSAAVFVEILVQARRKGIHIQVKKLILQQPDCFRYGNIRRRFPVNHIDAVKTCLLYTSPLPMTA